MKICKTFCQKLRLYNLKEIILMASCGIFIFFCRTLLLFFYIEVFIITILYNFKVYFFRWFLTKIYLCSGSENLRHSHHEPCSQQMEGNSIKIFCDNQRVQQSLLEISQEVNIRFHFYRAVVHNGKVTIEFLWGNTREVLLQKEKHHYYVAEVRFCFWGVFTKN